MNIKQALDGAIKKRVKGNTVSHGHCLQTVQDVLEDVGIKLPSRPASAYIFPSVCVKSQEFNQAYNMLVGNLGNINLKELPKWSILVWNKTKDHKHGHIEFVFEDDPSVNKTVSDYIQFDRSTYDCQKVPMAIFIPKF